jgi:hypothetical protein
MVVANGARQKKLTYSIPIPSSVQSLIKKDKKFAVFTLFGLKNSP